MGEWGTVCANITNMDCPLRSEPQGIELKMITDLELKEILKRADQMMNEGKIKNYTVEYMKFYSYEGRLKYDIKLTIIGACKGRSIKVLNALFWFPWKKYRGRDLGSSCDINLELSAFNPIDFILNGNDADSSTKICFKIFIPPDITPEEKFKKPYLDIRVHYPEWIDYTLENYPTTGPFEIQPYRSFNLTITDFDGLHTLTGAKVVIRRLVYYHERREYTVPENGTIRITRLKEDDYEIKVYWNGSYPQRTPFVYAGTRSAYDLASSKNLRTWVFNVEIRPIDLMDRPLNGASIILDGIEKLSENGVAVHTLVPYGNHSLQIYWKNLKIYDTWIWIGYHPTLMPEVKKPSYKIKLPIADLIVQAVDTGGNPVGANFTVVDLEGALPPTKSYSRNGFLNITQLPMGKYRVEAINCSSTFGVCVDSVGVYEPGKASDIELPIHAAELRIISADGLPLPNASVSLGPISKLTDKVGSVVFSGIPEGTYPVKVFWRGVEVYKESLEISRTVRKNISTAIYEINLKLVTWEGKPFGVLWFLRDSSGATYESRAPMVALHVDLVPDGLCNLTIYTSENITILSKLIEAKDLHGMTVLRLPIKDMVVKVVWENGDPIRKSEVILTRGNEIKFKGLTDVEGKAVFRNALFSNYSVRVNYPYTSIPVYLGNVTFNGEPVLLKIREARVTVKVIDWFGKPIRGAEIVLLCYGSQLSREMSNADGIAVFSRIPLLRAYEVRVKYDSLESRGVVGPGGETTIKLDVINIFGLIVNVSDIMALIPYIGAAVISAIIIVSVLIFRRITKKKAV